MAGDAFDRELEDLPQELRWRTWMGRIEAVIFASAQPVPRIDLAKVVGQGASVELLIEDIQSELAHRPALAGLAPHACDSGMFKGKRRIWGGRANVRRALYLAAFIASRHDPNFKAFRKQLQDAGKPVKLAVTACARKLLTIINAMLKAGQNYPKQLPELGQLLRCLTKTQEETALTTRLASSQHL